MTRYDLALEELRAEPRTWLITGVAGFIGSHLLEMLLRLDQRVIGIDNLSTGSPRNLETVCNAVSSKQWSRFSFREGTIVNIGLCREATKGVDFVLHHAGFVSVPLSLQDPIACHDTNVTGTLNLLIAARDHRVRRFVYASSKTIYGDDLRVPKLETMSGTPGSPYGASKIMEELYAHLFVEHYGLEAVGLRYFNFFGPRQNPLGGYAAVVAQWITTLLRGGACHIHGDGTNTRDFSFVANAVQANILAATAREPVLAGRVYNVASGHSTSLNRLYELITERITAITPNFEARAAVYGPARPGDILRSGADISKIGTELGYVPLVGLEEGLDATIRGYMA